MLVGALDRRILLALLVAMVMLAGCRPKIESEYGQIVGRTRGRSVNGTRVLKTMFEHRGARVRGSSQLGRVFDRADVVVWFPDRFRPPSSRTQRRIEEWLEQESGRTLVYVGRDFDATASYWESVRDEAPAEQYMEVRRRYAKARIAHERVRAGLSEEEECDWFALDRSGPPIAVRKLEGEWQRGIDPNKADIQLRTRIEPSSSTRESSDKSEMEGLLRAQGHLIVGKYTKQSWQGSSIIVIANGSWLLNQPLVNHEHRKLAGKLIDECGDFEEVMFLTSGAGEPIITSLEPNRHHGLEAFTVEPVNYILIHIFLLGIVFTFSVFPIFGRPREIEEGDTSDFRRHIGSLGELLSLTHDREHARKLRESYQQRVAGEVAQEPAAVPTATVAVDESATSAQSTDTNQELNVPTESDGKEDV